MNNKLKNDLIDCSFKLNNIGFNFLNTPILMFKSENKVFGTSPNARVPFSNADIIDITGSAYAPKSILVWSKYNTLIISKMPFTSKLGIYKKIPAVLDDVAQIAGANIKIANTRQEMQKALKLSSAVITSDGISLCFGRDFYEAYNCTNILEKNSETFLKANVIGGAKPVNKFIGTLERIFYLKKYSNIR